MVFCLNIFHILPFIIYFTLGLFTTLFELSPVANEISYKVVTQAHYTGSIKTQMRVQNKFIFIVLYKHHDNHKGGLKTSKSQFLLKT